jgi:hypothetical protein
MTLTETAQYTKKALVIVAITLVVIFSLWGGISYYLATRPVEVVIELPTKNFGLLPKPPLPKSKLTGKLSYNINTETGALPTGFPYLMKVYFLPRLGTTFLAPDKAKKLASSFSFKNGPEILSPTMYRFTDDKGGEFLFDLDSGNFRFKRPIATSSADPDDNYLDREEPQIESENVMINNFRKYLNDRGTMPDQLSGGKSKVFYNKPRQTEASEANVTLWQQDIKEGSDENPIYYPIVTPEYSQGLVKGVVTRFEKLENRYLSIDFIYWPVDLARFETYPVKTVEQAYEQLQNGEGTVVVPYSKSNVEIDKVYLAYILPKEYTPYLQPVYVFEGAGFAAYIPAITHDNFEP